MGATPPPSVAIAKRKKTANRLTPRKQAILWAERLNHDTSVAVLSAVKAGGSHKVAAEAGGFTLAELQFIFSLAEDGHYAYRDFRDEYFHHRAMRVLSISEAQIKAATSDEGSIADRKYALELIEPETFKEDASQIARPGGAYQANQFTFNVRTSWDDEEVASPAPPMVDAEDVEVVD